MAVTWMTLGALTSSSVKIRAKVAGATARLGVSTDSGFSDETFGDAESASGFGIVTFTAAGLTPNTEYWFRVEDAGVLDTVTTGSCATNAVEGEPWSFRCAVSSCAGSSDANTLWVTGVSNDPVFDIIRNLGPRFFVHNGDLHYKNISTNDQALFRSAYDDLFSAPRQHQLYREVPWSYSWDDHDYGANNSNRLSASRPAAAAVYRQVVPSYDLPDPANIGCWHSFPAGRVLFIISDNRSYKDPGSDPESPSKTMLGAAQKAWIENLLATSTAEALVWSTPVPWMGTGNDSWAGYDNERAEMIDMFREYGWEDRMVCISGDYHGLAMDSGTGNATLTGATFPCAVFGSLDSLDDAHIGSPTNQYDQGPTNIGSHRYGLIDVDDNGDRIILTLSAYINNDLVFTTALVVDTSEEPEPPEPEPPTPLPPGVVQSVATPKTRVTWLGCDLVSGRVIAELPDITGPVSRVLGAHTSAGLSMPIPLAGPAALGELAFQATAPGQTMIVPVVNNVPTAAFIVLERTGGTDAILNLGCVSLEGYLDRRYVLDHDYEQVDEASVIAAGLASDSFLDGIGLAIDAPPTGTLRDRHYQSIDDATIYQRLRELMGVIDGPEWTIDVDWEDPADRTVVTKTLRVRKHIGEASSQPNTVFSTRGRSETTYTFHEDYTDGKGANWVVAYSSGEGDDRPQSVPAVDIEPGWPRYERRFSPSSSITQIPTLNDHAAAELARLQFGSNVFQIQARWDATPRLNVDWRLGDDVAWDLVGHRHPEGVQGTGRVIGWELDMGQSLVKPILWTPPEPIEEA